MNETVNKLLENIVIHEKCSSENVETFSKINILLIELLTQRYALLDQMTVKEKEEALHILKNYKL